MIYLFFLAKLTPVKSLKSKSPPVQQKNYACLENVFATLTGIQPLSFIFFYWAKRWNLPMLKYFNQSQTHNFHKARRFKYYILNYKKPVISRLLVLYLWRDKSLDRVAGSQKQGGLFFIKKGLYGYLIIIFFLHLLVGNIRQELSWFFYSQVSSHYI